MAAPSPLTAGREAALAAFFVRRRGPQVRAGDQRSALALSLNDSKGRLQGTLQVKARESQSEPAGTHARPLLGGASSLHTRAGRRAELQLEPTCVTIRLQSYQVHV